MANADTAFITEKIQELRLKLLDLTNRNSLLNFRHSEKALTHVRIIDELPDFLFGSLIEGEKLTFKPLPEPDDEPHDEQTEMFQTHYREATLTDETYLEEIAKLIDTDDSFDDLAVIERNLKKRVREKLGMPPVDELKPLSNAQWARKNELVPKYDMPVPSDEDFEQDKHYDEYIQTLLKPKELMHKLSGLRRYITTDINETGVNTFYAAFGFLERYDNENSEKPLFAPLVLLQLDPPTEKKSHDGEVFISVEASGEDPQYNLPLAEKLKEFGLSLPELSEDDTPESYMDKVERLIQNQKGWRVRRFITFGRFQFARLVMYHDLDPSKWPANDSIENNDIIRSLIAGAGEKVNSSDNDDAPVYDIDTDPLVEEAAPILITEADSSQHSAIVDALKGNNLVIKGPPGTGKSQTITNLIANALAKDKKVLFIAEKMAALNVVYSRLQNAGLGDYCFELHSTKAKLKDIKTSLATTIENRKTVARPRDLQQRVLEIKEAQARLREYSDILNNPLGESGRTIHEIMWGEQSRRSVIEDFPVSIKRIKVEGALSFNDQKLAALCDDLNQLKKLEIENNKYDQDKHPWSGINVGQASSLKAQEIIQSFEECDDALDKFMQRKKIFEEKFNWTSKSSINEWKQAEYDCKKMAAFQKDAINYNLLKHLQSNDVIENFKCFLETILEYNKNVEAIKKEISSEFNFEEDWGELSKISSRSKDLNVFDLNSSELKSNIEEQEKQISEWNKNLDILDRLGKKIFHITDDHLPLSNLKLLVKATELLSCIDKEILFLRTEESLDEGNYHVLVTGRNQKQELKNKFYDLSTHFDLNFTVSDRELEEAIYELSTANIISKIRPKYYKAWKLYKVLSLNKHNLKDEKAAFWLRQLKKYRDTKLVFEQDLRYQKIAGAAFNGVDTDFDALININEWASSVREEFAGLDDSKEKIKKFLFNSDVSDLENIKKEAINADSGFLFDNILDENNIGLGDFIADMKSICNKKKELLNFLENVKNHNNLRFNRIYQLTKNEIKSAIKLKIEIIEQNENYKDCIDNVFNLTEADLGFFHETCALAQHLNSLNLPDSLDAIKYSPELINFSKELSTLLERLVNRITSVELSLKNLEQESNLDVYNFSKSYHLSDADLELLHKKIKHALMYKDALITKMSLISFMNNAENMPYREVLLTLNSEKLGYQKSAELFEYLYYRSMCRLALGKHAILDEYKPFWLKELRDNFQKLDKKILKLNCQELAYKLAQIPLPEGISRGRVSEYTDMGLVRHQALKEKSRAIPIRKLINRAGKALQALKPCFLMSPLSVAQYIGRQGVKFDLVVIDEASQMRPEDALGAIGRSGQIVVVGDPKQLPPTAFFNKQTFTDTDYEDEDKIDNESILDLALGRFRPTRDLRWHYRSRHESLIAFSNAHFYDDRLIVFPSPEDRSESFGVHCHYVGGTYNASCNVDEAVAVMEAARKFMHDHPDKSLGIATMNSSQRDLIYEEMYRLFMNDPVCEAYRTKWEGTLEPFFVKNLESVQGDERDAIFVSTVYGPNKEGQVMQRFGPINGKQGHRRLNVLFTRAKHNMVLFTSLRPDDIRATETSTQGLRAFKGFLEYAYEGKLDAGELTGKEPDSDFEICVKEKLESIGCEAIPQVGVAGFFIDLGVRHPDYPYGFLMGIECDGAAYHSSKSARDRDRIRQEVLEGLGWDIYRIWSTDWFHDPNKEFEKLKSHIEKTVKRNLKEKENEESKRVANVVELQKQIQNDLFNGQQDQHEITTHATTSVEAKQPEASNDNVVELFDTVSFKYIDDLDPTVKTVTIVTSQSDVDTGNINQHSAMGRALVGSEIDEEVEVSLPNGSRTLQIIEIKKYAS